VIALPPLLPAVKEIVTCVLPAVALRFVGALGVVEGVAVAVTLDPAPIELVAVIVNV
jgi:hypothetical protein